MFRLLLGLGLVMTGVSMFAGCGTATDPAVLAQRTKYLLGEEPAGALGVIEVRRQLDGEYQHHGAEETDHAEQSEPATADDQSETQAAEQPKKAEHQAGPEHTEHHHDHAHPHPTEPGKQFTVVGRIGGVPNPWSEGSAGFWIADNTESLASQGHDDDQGHDHQGHDHAAHGDPGHDPETCPFCKQSSGNPKALAIVQFEDQQGKILGIDARKLFDVSRNQTVVVRGRANFDDLGNLVISASGLYIRE